MTARDVAWPARNGASVGRPAGEAGDRLLHPVAVLAVAALLLNDHFLKAAYPGWLTGKLSDIAGLIVLPLLIHACVELVRGVTSRHVVFVCTAVTALGFSAMKLFEPAAEVYRWTAGALQWLPGALVALATDHGPGPVTPVHVTMDPTDLLALPAVLVVFVVARRDREERETRA